VFVALWRPLSVIWVGVLLVQGYAYGQIPMENPAGEISQSIESGGASGSVSGERFVERMHAKISKSILSSAEWIDAFFYDERMRYEENRTRVRLSFSSFLEEEEKIDFDANISLILVLPYLEGRFRFEVTRDPRDKLDFGSTAVDEVRERFEETDKRNTTVAARYFLAETARENISAGTGARFRGVTPTAYVEGRYRRSFDLDAWTLRFTHRFRWYTDKGLEARTRVDFERSMKDVLLLRVFIDGSWFQDEEGYFYTPGVSLFQPIDEKKTLEYQFANSFRTEPTHSLEEIILRVKYRQDVWNRWAYLEIAPQLSWPREKGYTVTPGLLMRLDLIFGRT